MKIETVELIKHLREEEQRRHDYELELINAVEAKVQEMERRGIGGTAVNINVRLAPTNHNGAKRGRPRKARDEAATPAPAISGTAHIRKGTGVITTAARAWIATRGGEFTSGELVDAVADLTREDKKEIRNRVSPRLVNWVSTMQLNKRESERGFLYKKTGIWAGTSDAPQPSAVAKNYEAFRAQIKTPAAVEE
jgi:hypothetical protein